MGTRLLQRIDKSLYELHHRGVSVRLNARGSEHFVT